jgi:hypothetical protein
MQVAASPSPSPTPQQQAQIPLGLLANLPGGYTGTNPTITATGPGNCTKAPSTRLEGSVSVTNPGQGLCGLVPAGTYTLTQNAPGGINFVRWEVYNATTGTLISTSTDPSITLQLTGGVTVVAVYSAPGQPSPSPVASPR